MVALLKNPIAYLSTSFVLFVIALPLISIGSTSGPPLLLWIGLAALSIAALIPPVQRLICGSTLPSPAKPENDSDETKGGSR